MSHHPPQQDHYAEWGREDVVPYLPDAKRVLEVGCGRGGFGRTLREHLGPAAHLSAIEATEAQAQAAREAGYFDTVTTGYFPDDLPGDSGSFDLVCFNDVLEHLVDPWSVLRTCHEVMTDDGRILAAVPSIRYAPIVAQLLRGRWEYRDTGTLDRTHVRFFTRASMVQMFRDCGYVVETCAGANRVADDPEYPRWSVLDRALGDMRWMHFVIVARRAHPGEDPTRTRPTEAPEPGRSPYRPARGPSTLRRAARRVRAKLRSARRP